MVQQLFHGKRVSDKTRNSKTGQLGEKGGAVALCTWRASAQLACLSLSPTHYNLMKQGEVTPDSTKQTPHSLLPGFKKTP